MDDTINTYDQRSECTGRSMVTLLIAWVSAALVASVLLRWKYMWIALAVLTLIFLIACGYAASTHRRSNERTVFTEDANIIESNRTIPTISGGTINPPHIVSPPAYQTYWINDLPPSYTVVIGTQPPINPSHRSIQEEDFFDRRLSNPPPYSVAIQPDHNQSSSVMNATSHQLSELSITSNHNKGCNPTRDQEDQSVFTAAYPSTQYFNNFIVCSAPVRGQKRNNPEQNSTNPTSNQDNI